jgi:hypothetical protein
MKAYPAFCIREPIIDAGAVCVQEDFKLAGKPREFPMTRLVGEERLGRQTNVVVDGEKRWAQISGIVNHQVFEF